jgi:hypothetical protein
MQINLPFVSSISDDFPGRKEKKGARAPTFHPLVR